jgi:hypothetical protein
MSDNITVSFQNAQLTSSTTSILLQGATYVLQTSNAISLAGTVTFSSFTLFSAAMNFNVTSGTAFNAQVTTPINVTDPSTTPSIEVTNFSGTVQVTWPTPTGSQTQALTSGEPLFLSNIAS